jgi:hypothetical protein
MALRTAPSSQRQTQNHAPSGVKRVLESPGQTLDPAARSAMEPLFGHDFGKVRVHADSDADASARSLNAVAFTVGHDIAFARGWYQPGTLAGRAVLAHELAHVIQQRGRGGAAPDFCRDSPHERSARDAARRVPFGKTVSVGDATGVGLALITAEEAQAIADSLIDPVRTLATTLRRREYVVARFVHVGPNGNRIVWDANYREDSNFHAEPIGIARGGSQVQGGDIVCLVTQDPCGPSNHDCELTLQNWAVQRGARLWLYVTRDAARPDRSAPAAIRDADAQVVARPYQLPARVSPVRPGVAGGPAPGPVPDIAGEERLTRPPPNRPVNPPNRPPVLLPPLPGAANTPPATPVATPSAPTGALLPGVTLRRPNAPTRPPFRVGVSATPFGGGGAAAAGALGAAMLLELGNMIVSAYIGRIHRTAAEREIQCLTEQAQARALSLPVSRELLPSILAADGVGHVVVTIRTTDVSVPQRRDPSESAISPIGSSSSTTMETALYAVSLSAQPVQPSMRPIEPPRSLSSVVRSIVTPTAHVEEITFSVPTRILSPEMVIELRFIQQHPNARTTYTSTR